MTQQDLDIETKQGTPPLPCPFCGSNDVVMSQGDTFRWRLVACNCCGGQGPDVRVQTSGDGTPEEWEHRAISNAIAVWNQRAVIDERKEMIDEALEAADSVLLNEQAELLRLCRNALDNLLKQKPELSNLKCPTVTLSELQSMFREPRPQGVLHGENAKNT